MRLPPSWAVGSVVLALGAGCSGDPAADPAAIDAGGGDAGAQPPTVADAAATVDGQASPDGGADAGGSSVGSVTAVGSLPCVKPNTKGATCKQLTVACPGVADITGDLQINLPSGAPVGTIVFTSGGVGDALYDAGYLEGESIMQNLLAAGYATVQVKWPSPGGFIAGPGGMRRVACRYATVARWIHENVHAGGAAKPFCASGNSAGGAQIAYGLAHHGLDAIFTMVQLTGGPPMGRLDHGCYCDLAAVPNPCGTLKPAKCYDTGAAALIDGAYGGTPCSSKDPTMKATFLADSIAAPGAKLAYPGTKVRALFGAKDDTVAVAQGLDWLDAITTPHTRECVPDTSHNVPSTVTGATKIVAELTTHCTIP